MRPSLKIALPVIPLSLNVVWFSVFDLKNGTGLTDGQTDECVTHNADSPREDHKIIAVGLVISRQRCNVSR